MSIYQKIANIQDTVQNIMTDASNPHFGNKYPTYEKVMGVLHPLLRKEGLMICHGFGQPLNDGQIAVKTYIVNIQEPTKDNPMPLSDLGDKIETTLYIPMTKNDPQMAGSAITYAKRYSVLALFGLGTEDDDGNGATKAPVSSPKPATATKEVSNDDEAKCPKCSGKMWDNRPKKVTGEYSAAAPDFKCRDKSCDGKIWPDKNKPMMVDGSGYLDEISERSYLETLM